MFDHVIDH